MAERRRPRCGPFARGALETAAVMAAFVGFGLAWAAAERAAGAARSYPGAAMAENAPGSAGPAAAPAPAPRVWLVDGFNVLNAVLLGGRDRSDWWSGPRRAELVRRAADFDDPCAEIWVVFDGPQPAREPDEPGPARPHPVFAPSADAWVLERLRRAPDPRRVAVVTRDRRLAARSRARGAQVVSPSDFLSRCQEGGDVG